MYERETNDVYSCWRSLTSLIPFHNESKLLIVEFVGLMTLTLDFLPSLEACQSKMQMMTVQIPVMEDLLAKTSPPLRIKSCSSCHQYRRRKQQGQSHYRCRLQQQQQRQISRLRHGRRFEWRFGYKRNARRHDARRRRGRRCVR